MLLPNPKNGSLLVGHSEAHAETIVREMRSGGYTLDFQRLNTLLLIYNALVENNWDVIISNRCMGDFRDMIRLEFLCAQVSIVGSLLYLKLPSKAASM
jgi:hypothetical protein